MKGNRVRVEYGVLGPLQVLLDDHQITVPAGRGRVLLATLLLRANEFVSTDELIDRLWDGAPPSPDRAKSTLQMVVTRLRQALGEANCVRTTTGGYVAEITPNQLDLARFRTLAAQQRCREALALWRGSALSDVVCDLLHRDDVAPLLEERLTVLEQRIDLDLQRGVVDELVPELRALTKEHPFRERFWGQLMLALQGSGRQAEALAAYREVTDLLADQLGIDPSSFLRDLHQRVLEGRAPAPVGWTVLCQLPPDAGDFLGREQHVADVVDAVSGGRDAMPIVVVTGAPGVGKSAFTVRMAHHLRSTFPDGQLFVRLDGAGRAPRDPAEVLGELLVALGEHVAALPDGVDARAAAFRSRVADRAMLLVLDDAAGASQIRPLLPGTTGSAVLVSSRRQITGVDGARTVRLPPFARDEALSLLCRMVGAGRIERERASAAELADLCGGLPLALRVVGARLTARSSLPLAALVTRLGDERRRLDELATGDLEVRAAFGPSYEALSPDAAAAFRGLGLLGAVDVASWVVAALTGEPDADRVVEQLVEANLLDEVGADITGEPRYRLHDLLAVYAAELAAHEDSAVRRRHYAEALCALTQAAWSQLPPVIDEVQPRGFELSEVLPPDETARLTADGPTWMLAEQLLIDQGVRMFLDEGWIDLAEGLVDRAMSHLDAFYPLNRVLDTYATARDAAREAGELRASWHFEYGRLLRLTRLGLNDTLISSFAECAAAFDELDEPGELASALSAQAHFLRTFRGDKPVLDLLERAVEAAKRSGDEGLVVSSLRELALALADSGRYAEALVLFDDMLASIGENFGAMNAAQVHHQMSLAALANGDVPRGRAAAERAMEIISGTEDIRAIAYVSRQCARAMILDGDHAAALPLVDQALRIFEQLNERLGAVGAVATLAEAHLALGRHEEVVELADRALVQYADVGAAEHEDRLRAARAEALAKR